MKENRFKDFVSTSGINEEAILEKDRVSVVRDTKWGHPELSSVWFNEGFGAMSQIYSQDLSEEHKKAMLEKLLEATYASEWQYLL